jgi:hypothetical protein
MSNTTKEELVNLVKDWVKEENEIKKLQKTIKQHREKKKKLTSNLVEIMKSNEIDCVNITEGKILYTNNKIKSTITKSHLFESLDLFFNNDKDLVNNIAKHILDTRKVKPVENIKLKKKK